jgi:murein tripeptide amidase MpaA
MNFNQYFTNEQIQAMLDNWSANYSNLTELVQIGLSHENRPIWLLVLTNRSTGRDHEKPALWIDANIHATELAGSTTALYIVEHLLTAYGSDDQVTRLLDTSVIYLVPRVNPDGAAWAISDDPRFVRSGVRRYPWEELDEGLHVQDINQDGRILQMRVIDPNGDWKISSLDPRLMEKRLPDEDGGTYYRLFPEGLLTDYDGYLVKMARSPQGLDFNRNFPFEWRPEADQHGAGPYPASEPEVRALVDFISRHPNINIAISFHTFSRVILRPYSTRSDDDLPTDDLWVYKKMGERGTQLTGYRNVSTFHDFKYHPKEVTTGAFDDWFYDHFGAFTFTIELWDLPTEAGIKDRKFIDWWRDHPHEEDLLILKWVEQNAPEGSYAEWQPFHHPQLGQVELGGWQNLYTWRNPPHAFMEAEAARHYPYILSLGQLLPHLKVHTFTSTSLGGGNYNLNLVIENTGFLPSYTSQQAKKRAIIRPLFVELEIPEECRIVIGKRRTELGHLEGRSNKLDVSTLGADSPMDNRARIEWTLNAQAGTRILIHITSERAGKLTIEHTLA